MCICHYCSILGLFLGEILYAIQKVIQCAAIGSVFSCLVFSFTVMLMLGVGLGYNHCYVEIQKPNARGWWRSDGNDSQSDDSNMLNYGSGSSDSTPSSGSEIEEGDPDRDTLFEELRAKRSQNASIPDNTTTEDTPLSPTVIVPLNTKNNILRLIRKIRRQRKNITLQFIAK